MTGFVEFQAVVLAGGTGSRMTEITDDLPKATLPVANLPMYWYALNALYHNNITNVIIVVNERTHAAVKQDVTNETFSFYTKLNIEVVYPGTQSDEWGTVKVIKYLADRLKHDFIFFSGDVISDINLKNMLQLHRAEGSVLTALFSNKVTTGKPPGTCGKPPKYRDLLILEANTDRLLFLVPEEDFEDVKAKHTLFIKFPHVNLTADYSNCNVYVMKRGIVNLIKALDDESFISVTTDFLPYLLEQQYTKADVSKKLIFGADDMNDEELAEYLTSTRALLEEDRAIKCFAYKAAPADATFIAHCNTIGAWFEANKAVVKVPTLFFDEKAAQVAGVNRKLPGVDASSSIAEDVELAPTVRIINSVVMKGAKIKERAKVQNSVICSKAIVSEDALVSNCIIGVGEVVKPDQKLASVVVKRLAEMEL